MSANPSPTQPTSDHMSARIRALLDEAASLKGLDHNGLKGGLRELLVSKIIGPLLPTHFVVGSGVVVNQARMQSGQTDVVIADGRIMRPLIGEGKDSVFAAESVIVVVEVKSWLNEEEMKKSDQAAALMVDVVCKDIHPTPLTCVFAYDEGPKDKKTVKPALSGPFRILTELRDPANGKAWLERNASHLDAVVLAGEHSWLKMPEGWRPGFAASGGPKDFEETKRFFTVLLDNCRTRAEERQASLRGHEDLLSAYFRNQSRPPGPGLASSSDLTANALPRQVPATNEAGGRCSATTASSYVPAKGQGPQAKGVGQDQVKASRDRLYATDIPAKQDAPLVIRDSKFDADVKNADQAFGMQVNRPAILSNVEASLRAENVKMGAAFSTDQGLSSILVTCAGCGAQFAVACTGRPSSISARCPQCGEENVVDL